MSLLRILGWLAAALLVLVVAAVLYLSFADLSGLKPRLEAAVTEAIGREFRIAGDFELDILPSPRVMVSDVSLANADWASEPDMLEIGELSLQVGLWSVLSGPIRVRELQARDLYLLSEQNADGESNWDIDGGDNADSAADDEPERSAGRGELSVPVLVEFAELRDVSVTQRSPDREDFVIALESLDMSIDEAGFQTLAATGLVNDLPMRLEGDLGPEPRLKSGRDIQLALSGSLGQLALAVEGDIGYLAELSPAQIDAEITAPDVQPVLQRLGIDTPLAGPLAVTASLTGADEVLVLNAEASVGEVDTNAEVSLSGDALDIDATLASLETLGTALEIDGLPASSLDLDGQIILAGPAYELRDLVVRVGDAEARFNGTVATDADGPTRIDLQTAGPRLADLSPGLPAIPFEATLTANLSPELLELKPLEVNFGDSDLTGFVTVSTVGQRIVTGSLQSRRLDLTPFAPAEEDVDGAGEGAAPEEDDAEAGEYVFTEDPLPFEELQQARVELELEIDELVRRQLVLEDIDGDLKLIDGDMDLEFSFAGVQAGRARGRIDLDTEGQRGELSASINLREIRANIISGEVEDPMQIPPIGVTLDIDGSGGSAREIAASMNGRLLLTQGAGRLENDLIGMLSGDIVAQLFSALNPFAKQEEYSNWECTIVAMSFEDGEGKFDGILAQGEKIKAVGGGGIDLNTEKINMEFNTKPRSGVGVSADMFVTPFVKLGGTLANPSIGLNQKGVLLQGGAAILTGGLSFVATALLDRASGEVDRCEAMLEEVGGHPPLEEPEPAAEPGT